MELVKNIIEFFINRKVFRILSFLNKRKKNTLKEVAFMLKINKKETEKLLLFLLEKKLISRECITFNYLQPNQNIKFFYEITLSGKQFLKIKFTLFIISVIIVISIIVIKFYNWYIV